MQVDHGFKFSLFIAGVQKCGTTSLKNYLSEHPAVVTHAQRECGVFNSIPLPSDEAICSEYFPDLAHQPGLKVIAKYVSLAKRADSLKRLVDHSPNCRVILMLRDRADRAYSSWRMETVSGGETRSFHDAISAAANDKRSRSFRSYIEYGFYQQQLATVLQSFPPSAVRVVWLEDFAADTRGVVSSVLRWLEIDNRVCSEFDVIHNKGGSARSKLLGRGIGWAINEQNPIKGKIRNLLGPKFSRRIGRSLRALNRMKASDLTIQEDTRLILEELYKTDQAKLKQTLDEAQVQVLSAQVSRRD